MNLKIVKCSTPKGYIKTNLIFSNVNHANQYVSNLNKDFLLNKIKQLEYPSISKKKKKELKFKRPNKYLLTKLGNKYCLWKSY